MATREPRNIEAIVQGFARSLRSLRSLRSGEARTRLEYIDPFWRLLGWDVANEQMLPPALQDVIIEPTVETVEGRRVRSRRPDYVFRVDGFPRFVVEAKAPGRELTRDPDAIFQAKTYAWSAQIPFAILTDFEQLRLLDCTMRPVLAEPERGLVRDFDLHMSNYDAQWQVIVGTLGRSAVAGGSLEQLLARLKNVRAGRRLRTVDRLLLDLRGTEPVDKAFLATLDGFRRRLASDAYVHNRATFPEADTRHGAARLTEAVQRLVDRLVFIRMCEDRNIISWGHLRDTLERAAADGTDLYSDLVSSFRAFDEQFNGYLFKPHPLGEGLTLSASELSDVIRQLYPPDSPYRFDAIGVDMLGTIYERFLGSAVQIRNRTVVIEPKPEVRHAGGVYYTPTFIARSIVRRVLGRLTKERELREILKLRVLDPACGSGSFLVAAYEFLLQRCEALLQETPSLADELVPVGRKTFKVGARTSDGRWVLSQGMRAHILVTCLYGVDIDAQAVEVTVMSLYLKLLEGAGAASAGRRGGGRDLLPPLDQNIKCGNSLIDPEAFDRWWERTRGGLFGHDPELVFKVNPFDWKSVTHGFGTVLRESNGFDCVIGNPPYVRVQEMMRWAPEQAEFCRDSYATAQTGSVDLYVVFVEKALGLLKPGGTLGFIMPHKFWQADYGANLRDMLAETMTIDSGNYDN